MPTTRLFFTALALAGAMTAARADDDPMAFARAGMGAHAVERADTRLARAAPVGASMGLSGSAMLDAAAQYIGSRSPTGFRGPWCGAFLGLVARKTGHAAPRDYRLARSWARAGVRSAPQVGAVAVFRHHVTIIAQLVPGGFIGLGGNQHRRVQRSRFPWRGVIAIREV